MCSFTTYPQWRLSNKKNVKIILCRKIKQSTFSAYVNKKSEITHAIYLRNKHSFPTSLNYKLHIYMYHRYAINPLLIVNYNLMISGSSTHQNCQYCTSQLIHLRVFCWIHGLESLVLSYQYTNRVRTTVYGTLRDTSIKLTSAAMIRTNLTSIN